MKRNDVDFTRNPPRQLGKFCGVCRCIIETVEEDIFECHAKTGHGIIVPDGTEEIEAKHIIIATGSCCADLPGVELDYDRIGTSTEALSYKSVPESLIVIGAGFIGLELGSVWARLGAKVTVLEYLDRILPGIDLELATAMQKIITKQGLLLRIAELAKRTKQKP